MARGSTAERFHNGTRRSAMKRIRRVDRSIWRLCAHARRWSFLCILPRRSPRWDGWTWTNTGRSKVPREIVSATFFGQPGRNDGERRPRSPRCRRFSTCQPRFEPSHERSIAISTTSAIGCRTSDSSARPSDRRGIAAVALLSRHAPFGVSELSARRAAIWVRRWMSIPASWPGCAGTIPTRRSDSSSATERASTGWPCASPARATTPRTPLGAR